ncbi:MAG: hypothetical protein L6R28_01495 [Planctomycetes bacterium]|nr:hypothetical protein [Planctomycetota bacterium]
MHQVPSFIAVLLATLAFPAASAPRADEAPPPSAQGPSPTEQLPPQVHAQVQSKDTDLAPTEFATLFMELVKRADPNHKPKFDAKKFQIKIGEKDIPLQNAYDEYRLAPEDARAGVLVRYLHVMMREQRDLPSEYKKARPNLRPIVRSLDYLEDIRTHLNDDEETRGQDVPCHLLAGRLAVLLAYDGPETIRPVLGDSLKEWKVGFNEAMKDAIENLDKQSGGSFRQLTPGLYLSPWRDNYDPARLLLGERLKNVKVGGELLAMAPNRDALLLTGTDESLGLQRLAMTAEALLQGARPISGACLRRVGDTWEPYLPPPDHPAYATLKALDLQYLKGAYERQQRRLQRTHEDTHSNIVVAGYSIAESTGPGEKKRWSFSIWSRGVSADLPQVDKLLFMDPERPDSDRALGMVDWSTAEKVLGGLLKPVEGAVPPRYRVTSFPTNEQLKKMELAK